MKFGAAFCFVLADINFLLSFIQKSFKTSIKKNSESKIKTENKFKYRSLFELKDDEDENSSENVYSPYISLNSPFI